MPKPTLEKPMPATYWASAMPSRPLAGTPLFASATASRRFFEMSSIAFRWNMSESSHAPLVV